MNFRFWYYVTSYFLLYAFLGWCVEVVFHVFAVGKIINRGFLNGPYCPIYGVGMILILGALEPVLGNPLLVFLGSIIIATLVEFLGGFVLYRIFHMRWWDYSDQPFNIGGYVCPLFSFLWGFGASFVVLIIDPIVDLNVHIMDCLPGYIFTAAAYLIFVADCICTVLTITKLNKDLKRVNELSHSLRAFSDDLTDKIGTHAMDANVRLQEGRVQAALGRAELRDSIEQSMSGLKAIYDLETHEPREAADLSIDASSAEAYAYANAENIVSELRFLRGKLASHPHFGYGRLYRAFPSLKHDKFDEELKRAADRVKNKRKSERQRTA
ncbi:MAG: putative ABC transporter permease [Eubacteriales bacterium]|nr:putative ABC transporter permease [Eubacteriales bacterium]